VNIKMQKAKCQMTEPGAKRKANGMAGGRFRGFAGSRLIFVIPIQ
jgi:hypothetical protein